MNFRSKKLFQYVVPTVLASCSSFLYTIVDGIFVGQGVGTAGLGAVNLAMPYVMIITALGMALYEKSLSLSVYDFRRFGSASVTTRTISDVTNIQFAVVSCIQMLLPVPVIFILSLVLTFKLDVQMGIVLLAVIVSVMILAMVVMKSAAPLFKKLQKLLDRMSTILLENITGVRVVRAFNNEGRERSRMNGAFTEYADTAIKANRRYATLDGLSFFCINVMIVAVYWLSGSRISMGHLQIGDVTAVIEYAVMVLFFLMMAQMTILSFPRAMECCNRIGEVLDYEPEIRDLEADSKEKREYDRQTVLEFKDVSFRYADAEEDTLSHLNFACRRGETTAIIGGTGSGKSTIASLMLRFHEVTEGEVLLNGNDLRKMTQHQLREKLSYVQQKAWLFSGTIAENLRYGKEDATDQELMHALRIAQAEEFVNSLPKGLDSFVAQGGTNFSGGQRQRLSIARALVKKPELYIFDDSFSALDFKTDAALRRALESETRDAAVVIIAQRVSSIRHAEQIIVLHEGKMAGIGTHEQLLENCPIYKEISDSQTKEV